MMRLIVTVQIAIAAAPVPAHVPSQVRIDNVLPAGATTTQIAITPDGRRVYYGDLMRAVWLYDRTQKWNARLANGAAWDLTVSPTGNALAYERTAPGLSSRFVWILPLDPRTGLASGAERRASVLEGDAPSISPDGKWLAFAHDDSNGVGQSIVVAPLSGGRERTVVASVRGGISNIRWSPDSRALFFGTNPAIECNPVWSCLLHEPGQHQITGSVRRVAVSGGTPKVIARMVGYGWPGLSTDGSLLAYVDTGFPVRLVFAQTNGRALQSFAVPARQTVEGWLNGSTLVFSDHGDVRRLRAYSIADASNRLLVDSLQQLVEPSWSPDGQSMATVHCVADRCELRIGRADGSLVKLVQLRERYRGGNLWSRDQRWIAYVGSPPSGEYHVNVIDVATGRLTTLTAVRSVVPSLLWDEESNSVLVTIALGTGAARHEVFERVGLDGQVRLIRDFVVGASLSGGSAITSTTGLLMSTAGVRRVTLEGDSANVVVLPKGAGASTSYSVLALSARRIALRRSSDDNYHTVIEVVNTDGSSPVTIDVPFAVFAGPNQRRFLPGDSAIVLWGGPTASEPDAGVYLVSIDTKSVKKLFTVPLKSLTRELSVSPDGRTILYVTSETASPRVFIMDLSSLRLSWQ